MFTFGLQFSQKYFIATLSEIIIFRVTEYTIKFLNSFYVWRESKMILVTLR